MAKYIAAAGGEHALNSIHSMYAIGKVKMGRVGEIGGFLLWQKLPDLWSLELMVSGFKISDGKSRGGRILTRLADHPPPLPTGDSFFISSFTIILGVAI